MKKVFSYLVLAGSCFSLMACGQTTKNSSVTNTSETNRKEIKVNYYDTDGKTLLKNEKVNSIKDILKFKPEKQGKNFEGWYVKPDYSRNQCYPCMQVFQPIKQIRESLLFWAKGKVRH